jgi:hypothetical protein
MSSRPILTHCWGCRDIKTPEFFSCQYFFWYQRAVLSAIFCCQYFPVDFLVLFVRVFFWHQNFSRVSISVKLLMLESLRIPPCLGEVLPSSRVPDAEAGESFCMVQADRPADFTRNASPLFGEVQDLGSRIQYPLLYFLPQQMLGMCLLAFWKTWKYGAFAQLSIMSCHGTCPVHDFDTNQETTEALEQDLTYFGSYPYDILPCCGQCPQPFMNSTFDSFGTTGLPANAWVESAQNDQTYLAGGPEYLMLQQVQPAIKDQNAVTKPSSGDEEVK